MRSLGRDLAKTTAKLVEDPERLADRIITFAELVGRENVIAGTDCGLGGRVHPQSPGPSCLWFQVSREILEPI
jgi:methionine synthase II (cobalamin-independent)